MYKLKYGGVVKLTPSKVKRDFLLSQGFELVGEEEKEPGEKEKEANKKDNGQEKEPGEKEKEANKKDNGQEKEVDYTKLLKADIIEILDEKGIEYNGNMNKDELISLL